jgi:hypothetical protein
LCLWLGRLPFSKDFRVHASLTCWYQQKQYNLQQKTYKRLSPELPVDKDDAQNGKGPRSMIQGARGSAIKVDFPSKQAVGFDE